jgi:hypothetical protein
VALVAVKSAVIKGVISPVREEQGSIKRHVPPKISRRKPSAINCMSESRFIFFGNIYPPKSKILLRNVY